MTPTSLEYDISSRSVKSTVGTGWHALGCTTHASSVGSDLNKDAHRPELAQASGLWIAALIPGARALLEGAQASSPAGGPCALGQRTQRQAGFLRAGSGILLYPSYSHPGPQCCNLWAGLPQIQLLLSYVLMGSAPGAAARGDWCDVRGPQGVTCMGLSV